MIGVPTPQTATAPPSLPSRVPPLACSSAQSRPARLASTCRSLSLFRWCVGAECRGPLPQLTPDLLSVRLVRQQRLRARRPLALRQAVSWISHYTLAFPHAGCAPQGPRVLDAEPDGDGAVEERGCAHGQGGRSHAHAPLGGVCNKEPCRYRRRLICRDLPTTGPEFPLNADI